MALSESPSARHRLSQVGQDIPRRCRCSRSSGGVTWAATKILRAIPLKPAHALVGGGSGVKGIIVACSSSREAVCLLAERGRGQVGDNLNCRAQIRAGFLPLPAHAVAEVGAGESQKGLTSATGQLPGDEQLPKVVCTR